jgi:ComF family protein
VPLHKNRENQRGFNQAEILANGVSRIIRVSVLTDGIRRAVDNKSQTSKNRSERNKNTDKIFSLPNSAVLEGKHVLLLDDVITTGATILSCGQTLSTVKNLRLSVAALAVTN